MLDLPGVNGSVMIHVEARRTLRRYRITPQKREWADAWSKRFTGRDKQHLHGSDLQVSSRSSIAVRVVEARSTDQAMLTETPSSSSRAGEIQRGHRATFV